MPRKKTRHHSRGWGEGSIVALPNGRHRAYAPRAEDGARHSQTFDSHAEAAAWLCGPDDRQPAVLLLGDYLERWYRRVEPTLYEQTWGKYRRAVRAAEPLATMPLADVRADDWQRVWNALLVSGKHGWRVVAGKRVDTGVRGPLARRTVGLIRTILSVALNAAVPDYLAHNPIRRTKLPAPTVARPKAWRRDEVDRLLATTRGDRDYPLYCVGLDCGARLGELRELRWTDLDAARHILTIERSVTDNGRVVGPTKTRRSRTVRLVPETVALLTEHRKRQPPGETLLFGHGGRAYSARELRRALARACERAGIRAFPPHALRHTCASLQLADRVSIPDVARRLGHANPGVTARVYAHVIEESEARGLESLRTALYGRSEPDRAEWHEIGAGDGDPLSGQGG